MEVRIIILKRNIVVVRSGDNLKIISNDSISTHSRVGEAVDISQEEWSSGTDYGIDWTIAIPDGLCVSAERIQKVMHDHGLYTEEDLRNNPNLVVQAVSAAMKLSAISLINSARIALGGN